MKLHEAISFVRERHQKQVSIYPDELEELLTLLVQCNVALTSAESCLEFMKHAICDYVQPNIDRIETTIH